MGKFLTYALVFGAGWLIGPYLFGFIKMTLGGIAGGFNRGY